MGFKPPTPAESRRGANGCRWEITRVNGVWSMTVTVPTTDGLVSQTITLADITAATTGAERSNTQSLLDKCQAVALAKAGWIDDGLGDPA